MQQVFWALFYKLLLLLVGLVVLSIAMRFALKRVAKWERAKELQAQGKRCVCGYALVGLELPRCPECGRAIGFDKTFEEMGINPAEIRPKPKPRVPTE